LYQNELLYEPDVRPLSLLLSSLELSDTKVYEPPNTCPPGTASHFKYEPYKGVDGGGGEALVPTRRVARHRWQGTVLNLRTTTSQKCAAVPRRARI